MRILLVPALVPTELLTVANIVLIAIALLVFLPCGTLLLECLAALLPYRQEKPLSPQPHPRIAVLMPAHNEAIGIRPVLEGLLPQLGDSDRLVVVADNCTDDTASIARSTGATVIERENAEHRGKGYALDYGVQYLADDPPDVVIIVDADCQVEAGALERLARQAKNTGCPAQSRYLMEQPAHPKPKDAVSALAFLVKNQVRLQGLAWLNLPCLLTGTGMAFPWAVIRQAVLASGNIVEDMQLGIDLAIAGYSPKFCPAAKVIGMLPQQDQAAKSQRTRWEHGHLQTIATQVPKLLQAALRQKRIDLLAMALDLSIPPLSLLVMLWLATTSLTIGAGFLGLSWLPVLMMGVAGGMLVLAILLAWLRFGRDQLPAKTLLAIPLYVLWKIPLYLAFLVRPQTKWVRTERDG